MAIEKQLSNKATDEMFQAIVSLKSMAECRAFFRDLCTLSELTAMTERFQVAKMVDQEVPYREVSRKTGASTATVTRVAHWLHHGMGGYRLALERSR